MDLSSPALLTASLSIGYVPLTDAAVLVVAEDLGFFARHGLRVALSPAASWAGLRDRVAYGALDAAHMLYPMPIAAALGLVGPAMPLTVAAGLGRNGNTIVLSTALAQEMGDAPMPLAALRFAEVARGRNLRLAVVHPVSSHNYLLRHWLESGVLDPDRDVTMSVLPPPAMPAALASGAIDGFCVGEPWGSAAVLAGAGRAVVASGDIWPDHPEKVFVFRASAAAAEPQAAIAATAAIIAAARWLDEPANHPQAAAILARHAFPSLDLAAITPGLGGWVPEPDGGTRRLSHPLSFREALPPHMAHAAFWLSCMRRGGHLPAQIDQAQALAPWNNDLFLRAASALGEPLHAPTPLPTESAA
ncbi:NitT/TauT family transport system ATP-binding protein/nitrate/nitrite transport system substrate-binding protein [Humitalea rosea]|uniref:NitT/TauT family transport system ATP-binding protein/nitrate/nitrite transport system substrate-binding protein n=1 Tax=Humitalea rosea TaxID=990373 RepID=A0A2W7IA87_9PROT|nr:CmpA/NrtA family ABC transporter substrate-binding protein [Humitalea rosea]PZW43038.1 NitT/TauT family transport system ATP-binding protein/nitrate/nitrite transport system substrate-binding protein [Humitalea rosea]